MAKKVSELGVDGLLSVTPYYNKPTQEGLFHHFKTIAESVSTPIVLYNVPGRTSTNLLPDTVVRLAEIENICALKAASGNIGQIGELAIKVPEGFKILSGDDPNTLPIIAFGGVGVISVISNQVPSLVVQLTHLCLEGKFKEALKIQRKLFNLMKLDFIETNPIPVKAGLAMMGLIEENYRLPMVPMAKENKEKLRKGMEELGLL
jgi:4-hydroxy-tetrahydrodipicolinate synthase